MNAVAPSPASRTSQMCCSLSGSSYSFIPDGGCAVLLEVAHQRARLRVGLVLRLAAELDEQPAAAVGEHRALVLVDAEQRHVLDQRVVHPLDRDRLVLARDRDVVGGAELVRVADDEERDARRLRDQLERRLEDRHARRLRADERARDLEPLLGEQLVEVVARDAARDLRIAGADLVARSRRRARAAARRSRPARPRRRARCAAARRGTSAPRAPRGCPRRAARARGTPTAPSAGRRSCCRASRRACSRRAWTGPARR